ncbi:DUF2167 domain-containing protein [Dokdonella koreensis]|uniref:Membrane protein n=1 Tax=Dokdonella koreensis DS-123 TaxID=1300342 RepID=A0A160DWD3_9GAMM|nr:DUF2167 domain-containing protein [Dokdonella koreensis]ANB18734.1 Putative membrane protein [Dokdonella koreensis DS-123]
MSSFLRAIVLIALLLPASGRAEEETGDAELQAFLAGLTFRSGTVVVPEAHATLALKPGYAYLDATDAQAVLEQLWGNPPDTDILGLILPQGRDSLLDERSWAVAVTYSDDGHVSDAEAATIDYAQMLTDMQAATREANPARQENGYDAVELTGWAESPRYDGASNKLYWAKDLVFGESPDHTLNYDIRTLGRHGYLSLNAIAPLDALPQVREGMQELLTMAEFDAGYRYADYDAATDKAAAYGIGALVAGTLAAKTGLFAKIGLVLLKFWKLIALAVVAFGSALPKLFKRKH